MCYENFIGVRGCEDTESKSGLYIDDLEGINTYNVAKTNDNTANAFEFLKDKVAYSIREFAEFVRTQLKMEPPICLSGCNYQEEFSTPSLSDLGVKYQFKNLGGLSRLVMHGLTISVQDAGSLDVTITDGLNPETKTFELTKGINNVDFEYFPSGSTVTIFAPNILGFDVVKCQSNTGCSQCDHEGWSVKGYEDGSETNTAYGFKPNLCSECSDDQAMCMILHRMKQGALFYAGAQVLKERLASDRINNLTIFGEEWAIAKVEEWEAKAEMFVNTRLLETQKYLRRIDATCFDCVGLKRGYMKP